MTYSIFADLDQQWTRLCTGRESAPDVASSLHAWQRECHHLARVTTLGGVRELVNARPAYLDDLLRYLVTRAKSGDTIAHRTILQCFLPALLTGRRDGSEVLGDAWALILQVPTDHPVRTAAWIGMRFRHLTSPNQRECGTFPLGDGHSVACENMSSQVEFESFLAGLSPIDQRLMRLVFVDGYSVAEAGQLLGLSSAAARQRKSRAMATLRSQLASA